MSDNRFGVGGQGGYLGPRYGPLYLDMLVDVKIGTPTNQYVLTYNSATNVWEPQPAGAGADTKTFVFENGVQVGTVSRYVNFNGGDFNVTENAGSDWFLIELASGAVAAHDLTGASHTEDATGGAGNVLRASGATAFAWAQLGHGDLGSVTSDQHHAQQHTLSGADHTGDLIYTQVDAIVDIAGVGANNLLSRADHVHTDLDGSSKITYSNLSSIPSTFDPVAHDLTSAYHTDSGLTTGHFLKATGLTTFAWQAHGLGASDVGAYTTAQTDTAIDTDITTHAGIATAHQDAPGLIATHAAIATAHQDAPGLIATHAAISGAHHAQGHVLSGTDHTATGLTVGWVISADSATTFSWKAPTGGSDADAIHDNVADEINQIADKASPVGADVLIIEDSAGAGWTKKKVSITNLPGGADADAIHDNVSNEIQVITPKASPAGADVIIIEDSASTWAKKSVLISNLPAGSPSFGLPVSIDIGDAQAEGTSGDSARADHQHAFAAPGAGYPQDIAAAESDGVATTAARSDHVHAHGTGYSADAHHNQAHALATTGDHTGTLPLTDLAVGTQGGIIRRGAADWEEFARGTQYKYLRAGASDVEWQARKFSITACIISPEVGYKTVWRAPFACTCVEIQGRQKGGTSTVINARYNGTTDVATADLTLTAADTWYTTSTITQTAWAVDSWLEVEVVTVGSATEITIQVEFTEP